MDSEVGTAASKRHLNMSMLAQVDVSVPSGPTGPFEIECNQAVHRADTIAVQLSKPGFSHLLHFSKIAAVGVPV